MGRIPPWYLVVGLMACAVYFGVGYLSSSVEALSGYAPGRWVGASLRDVVAERLPEITDFGATLDLLGPGEHASWEASIQPLGNGPPRILNLTVANHIGTPEVAGWVITARDVTTKRD